MRKPLLLGVLISIASSALFSEEQSRSIVLTQANFETTISESTLPLFIKVYAPWCGYCKKLAPTWQRLAQDLEGQVKIAVIDGIEERGLVHRFPINGFPSLFFTQDGVKYWYYDGTRQFQDLKEFALEGFLITAQQKWFKLRPPPSTWTLLQQDFVTTMIQADKNIDTFFQERGWSPPSELQKVLAVLIPSLGVMGLLFYCLVKQIRKMDDVSEEKKYQ